MSHIHIGCIEEGDEVLVAACAQAEGAEAIVTRDDCAFNNMDGVRRFTPGELIATRGFAPEKL